MRQLAAIIDRTVSLLAGDVLVLEQFVVIENDDADARYYVSAINFDEKLLILKKLEFGKMKKSSASSRVGDFFVFQYFERSLGSHSGIVVGDEPLLVVPSAKPASRKKLPQLLLSNRHSFATPSKMTEEEMSPGSLFAAGRRAERLGVSEGDLHVVSHNEKESLVAFHRKGHSSYISRADGVRYSEAVLMLFRYKLIEGNNGVIIDVDRELAWFRPR